MAANITELIFTDGRVETVKINARVMVETERNYKNQIPALEGTLWAAWCQLGKPGKFEEWIDTVDDFNRVNGEATVPSQPAASDGS